MTRPAEAEASRMLEEQCPHKGRLIGDAGERSTCRRRVDELHHHVELAGLAVAREAATNGLVLKATAGDVVVLKTSLIVDPHRLASDIRRSAKAALRHTALTGDRDGKVFTFLIIGEHDEIVQLDAAAMREQGWMPVADGEKCSVCGAACGRLCDECR